MSQFPFSAIVGMDELRLALVLNAVSPGIGGVLVRGEKGTAKSTMVRALAAVLPDVDVVVGCRFSCDPGAPDPECPDGPHEAVTVPAHQPAAPDDSRQSLIRSARQPTSPDDPRQSLIRPAHQPAAHHDAGSGAVSRPARLVELPVGASEDRLVGALDIERALTEGVKAYEPGLLAAAHRGVLYVDEVNLLHDHLVDLLLDAAALGTCYVEREGVSVRHAARFLLVGTMNPEEGELRPQLLDRFGLTVEAAAPRDARTRAEVVRRRLSYDADPAGFAGRWQPAEDELAHRIVAAQRLLPRVILPDAVLRQVASVCAAFDVDGMRADLVTARAAVAHAAWRGRLEVTADDVRTAARLALPHRRRRQPFDAPDLDEEQLEEALAGGGARGAPPPGAPHLPGDPGETAGPEAPPSPGAGQNSGEPEPDPEDRGPGGGQPSPGDPPPATSRASEAHAGNGHDDSAGNRASPRRAPAETAAPGSAFRVKRLEIPGTGTGAAGRRSRARTDAGRVTGALVPRGRLSGLHLAATVAAAAPHQVSRGRRAPDPLLLRRGDLREARREGRESNLVLFVVDASGSMAARARMGAVKGAVLSLLLDAYQRRDKVGMITFRGGGAQLLLPPTASVEAAAARLAALPTGGRTPLAAGLLRAHDVLRTERLRDPRRRPLLVLVTDGRATAAPVRRPGGAAAARPGGGQASGAAGPVAAAHRAAALLAAVGVASVVVDCESGPIRLGLAAGLARALQGPVLRLEELAAGPLADSVRALKEVA
jgi:magnesium chelatase subunit D